MALRALAEQTSYRRPATRTTALQSLAKLSGLLATLGPLAFITAAAIQGPDRLVASEWSWEISVACAALISAGGLLLTRRPWAGRPLATAGLCIFSAQLAAPLSPSPALTLTIALCVLSLLALLWAVGSRRVVSAKFTAVLPREALAKRARVSSYVYLLTWFVGVVAEFAPNAWTFAATAVSFGIAWFFWARVLWDKRSGRPHHGDWFLALSAAVLVSVALGWSAQAVLTIAAGALGAMLQAGRSADKAGPLQPSSFWELILAYPARLLVVTFLGLCSAGAVALALPGSSASGSSVGLLDAAFTSVSAACVTGLIVLDTPNAFSSAGQVVLVVLIQMGGLGIMSFSTAAYGLLGRRLSLRHEGSVAGLLGERDRGDLFNALRRLLALTFGAEAAGALLLAVLFASEGDTVPQALWRGIFTAVSAFCNAGFALQSDNLVPYQNNGFILHIVAALIIVGGLSPAVVLAIPRLVRGKGLPMQAKLALTATAVLLAGGALAIAIVEWNNTLGGLSFWNRLNNAWLQSATLRTAGFNSVDIAAVQPAVLSLMMLFMFIGGSPGGTAGGIKTTTAMVLLLTVIGSIRGRREAAAFGRSIPHQTVYKAAVITTIGLLSALGGFIALQLTQTLPNDMALFEVVSAFGTVGLSIGGTPLLDGVGKVIIMTAMFMGRVGPLTLFIFLAGRSTSSLWKLPEEEIDVG